MNRKSTRFFATLLLVLCATAMAQDYAPGQLYIRVKPEWRDRLTGNYTPQTTLTLLAKYDPYSAFLPYKVATFRPLSTLLDDHPTLRCYFVLQMETAVDPHWLRQIALQQAWADDVQLVPRHRVATRPPAELRAEYWHVADLNLPEAWEMGVAAQPVSIAVIDNGFAYLHEDLQAALLLNTAEVPLDGLDNDGNGYVDDYYGYDVGSADGDPTYSSPTQSHGTYVAGVACAVSNNGKGVLSAGYNCKLLCIKASRYEEPYIYNYLDGIEYALKRGVKIINLSFGSYQYSAVEEAMIQEYINRGAIVVAAAGNNTTSQPFYPAAYQGVLSVGAMGNGQNIAFFSNYGDWVDLMAPGLNIYTTDPTTHGSYSNQMGTSMASPVVASLLGLMQGMNPTATPAQLLSCLTQSCQPIDSYNPELTGLLGSGKINAAAACNCIRPKTCDEDTVRTALGAAAPATSIGFADLGLAQLPVQQFLAQKIELPQHITHVQGAELMLTGNTAALGTGYLTVYLWDQKPDGNIPGQVLATRQLSMQTIGESIQNRKPAYVSWGQDIPVNRTVYVGVRLSDMADRELRLLATDHSPTAHSTYVRYGSASWGVEQGTYGQHLALAIFPIGLSYDKALKIKVMPQRLDEQTLSLSIQASSGIQQAANVSWQFSDDRVVHTGNTINRIVENNQLSTLELVVQDAVCTRVYTMSQLLQDATIVDPPAVAEAIQVYAHKQDLRVRLAGPQDATVAIDVLDLQGRTYYHTTVGKTMPVQSWQLDMGSVAAGMYLVKVKANDLVHSTRVILQP